MSTLRKQNRAKSGRTERSKDDAEERFFSDLRDMTDLLKTWALGAAIVGAGIAIASSEFSVAVRLAGALACITMGLMVTMASVLLFSRNRFAIHGHQVREKARRLFKFVLLMIAGVSVCITTVELLKQTTLTTKTSGGTLPVCEPGLESLNAEPPTIR